ncbi:Hypothetical protein, putative [Bodo saltans]|uniref:Uncharacterized protein n=1 Tax=Bodo saltans TaxID=75058 RepID=A0A0S4JSH4_BODSA|nr:Hypothetical protein, putative [Bodo saltans]|eukprot:CUG92282.1 Hypothetical protein, putative [Bodo saltans]
MERPRLVLPSSQQPPNVLIAFGFPWYVTESRAASDYFSTRYGLPTTVRAYEDPINGSSKGVFFVEYAAGVPLEAVYRMLCDTLQSPMVLLHLTVTKWDRSGRLPDLPVTTTVEPLVVGLAAQAVVRGGGATAPVAAAITTSGFGPEGYLLRCGPTLGLPNTVLNTDALARWRKRQRPQ